MENGIASRVLYCDSSCIVVNKIAGEAVEGAGKSMVDLPKLLAAELSGSVWPPAMPAEDAIELPAAVHRLDVPVSGCAAFARTKSALRFLNEAFAGNAVEKIYRAVVELPRGKSMPLPCPGEKREYVHWLQFDSKKNKTIAYNEAGHGRKKAVLRCRFTGRGDNYLFMEIELVTGRHHQIRAQLERLGLHIKGDLKYGARRSENCGGIRLHAFSLSFPSPADPGSRITVQADPPLQDNLWKAFCH